MNREALHDLINRIPEDDLAAAQRYLEYLAISPAYRAATSAPPDDERVTAGDSEVIEKAAGEIRADKVVSHDAILREFGLRLSSYGLSLRVPSCALLTVRPLFESFAPRPGTPTRATAT